MTKKYLILGGTGPIGNGIINILSSDEDTILYVTTRQSIQSTKERIQYITGNAHESSFLFPLLESNKWDAIIDCMIYPYFEFAAKMDKFLAHTKQYIFLSSATVFAESKEPLTEDSDKLVDVCPHESFVYSDVYAITKARQERLLQQSTHKNWTIIRPYITYGDYRLQLGCMEKEYWLYGAMHHRPIVFAQDIADKYVTMTHCSDVGKIVTSLIGHPAAMANDFNAVCSHALKWKDVLDIYIAAIEDSTGYRPKTYWTPHYESFQGGGRYEDYQFDRLYNRIFDNSKLAACMDVSKFVTPKDGLTNCISNFVKKPQFKSINFMSEIKKAELTGCWPSLREIEGYRTKLFVELVKHKLIPSSL